MKRIASLLLVIAFAGTILLSGSSKLNGILSNHVIVADGGGGGIPVPPLPPCAFPASASLTT
jgi:hypothetical protein